MSEITESSRHAARRAAKIRLAQHRQLIDRLTEINAAIRQEEQQLRRAEDAHSTACRPLQDSLGDIERQLVEAAVDRRVPDQELQSRRRELLDQLHENNVALERAAEESKFKLAPLLRERHKLTEEMRLRPVDTFALQRPGLINPELAKQKFALTQAIRFATQRCDQAAKKVEAWASASYPSGEATLANWQYELAAAGRELVDLQRRMAELLEAINAE